MNTTTETVRRSAVLSYFSLFTSLSTLLCCALPSLLVLFGLGASVASTFSLPTRSGQYWQEWMVDRLEE